MVALRAEELIRLEEKKYVSGEGLDFDPDLDCSVQVVSALSDFQAHHLRSFEWLVLLEKFVV